MKTGKTSYLHSSNIITHASTKKTALFITSNLLKRVSKVLLNSLKKSNFYIEIICALLIILFVYTGLNKIMDYDKFKYEIGRSPFIQNMADPISVTIPVVELLISLFLINKRTRLPGLYLCFLIMALFTGYIWLMLNYAYDLPCSCGGILAQMSWKDHLYFNALFTLLAMIGVILQTRIHLIKS